MEVNDSDRIPYTLHLCGHTVCQICLDLLKSRPNFAKCPTCNKQYQHNDGQNDSINQATKCFALLEQINSFNKLKKNQDEEPDEDKEYK